MALSGSLLHFIDIAPSILFNVFYQVVGSPHHTHVRVRKSLMTTGAFVIKTEMVHCAVNYAENMLGLFSCFSMGAVCRSELHL